MRFGSRKTFKVRLAEAPADSTTRVVSNDTRPDARDNGTSSEKLGITVAPIGDDAARSNRIPENRRGLRVVSTDPDGPSRNRLFEDDILVEVMNPNLRRTLRTPADLAQVLSRVENGGYLSLLVYNAGSQSTRVVNLRVGQQ
jgi:hypothetical protein